MWERSRWLSACLAAMVLIAGWGYGHQREAEQLRSQRDALYALWLADFDPARGTGGLRAYLSEPDLRYLDESQAILWVDARKADEALGLLYGPDFAASLPFVRARQVIRAVQDPRVGPEQRAEALRTVIAVMEDLRVALRRASKPRDDALPHAEGVHEYLRRAFSGAVRRLDRTLHGVQP